MKSLQLQSCLHDSGTIECALFEVDIPEPGPDEVMIKVEAAPINPSDLGLMFGVLDTDGAVQGERNGYPSVSLAVPDAMMRAMSSRLNQWLPVGNEAGGTVVAAGTLKPRILQERHFVGLNKAFSKQFRHVLCQNPRVLHGR